MRTFFRGFQMELIVNAEKFDKACSTDEDFRIEVSKEFHEYKIE